MAYKTIANWISKSDTNPEYILSVDEDDLEVGVYVSLAMNNCDCIVSPNKSAIQAINRAALHCNGGLLIIISDDFDCPEHWDTLLLNELKGKSDFLVKTQDGIQPTLITLPIMDRAYYNRFDYIYHPEYLHMACDVELTAVGMMLGKVIKSDLLFPHNHYSTGKTPQDIINEKNDRTYAHGDEVLAKHLLNNFGIENPLIHFQEIQWH